jgi:hypothetical protein
LIFSACLGEAIAKTGLSENQKKYVLRVLCAFAVNKGMVKDSRKNFFHRKVAEIAKDLSFIFAAEAPAKINHHALRANSMYPVISNR